jgi:hypothetical protein
MTDYTPPFAFSGTVRRALVDVSGAAIEAKQALMKMYLARQWACELNSRRRAVP